MPAIAFRPSILSSVLTKFEDAPAIPRLGNSPMPVRLRSTLHRSLSRPLERASVFYCPSCATWRRALSTRSGASTDKRTLAPPHKSLLESVTSHAVRPYTTASTSAITAGRNVPPQFKELHHALSGIKDAAIEQVNLSRLQLALRGLESETPLIRVAGEWLLIPVLCRDCG